MEFNYEKFQEMTPTHLDQYTKSQALIQRTDCRKRHLKVLQSPDLIRKRDIYKRIFKKNNK